MPLDAAHLVPLVLALLLAIAARAAKAFTTGGALVGAAMGALASIAYGGVGLGLLAVFVVGGSGATKVGWKRKKAEGTAERGEGRRDAARVFGKGGVTAAAAALAAFGDADAVLVGAAFCGSLAAALADTLATEVGVLAAGTPRSLPAFRPVPAGTPGAVSVQGTAASLVGSVALGAAAWAFGLVPWTTAAAVGAAGFLAALAESVVTSVVPGIRRVPGWLRNVFATGAGAGFAILLIEVW